MGTSFSYVAHCNHSLTVQPTKISISSVTASYILRQLLKMAGAHYIQYRTQSSAVRRLDVVFLLFLYFWLTVGGCGERNVGSVEVMSIFAFVCLVLALTLIVVANTKEYEADEDEPEHSNTTCHNMVKCKSLNCFIVSA